MSKAILFISHINEERDIALVLKDFIERKFLKSLDVFVSSHEESIGLGDEWLSVIKESMKGCGLIIVICSPLSIFRPWINFEAGAGWVRGIPVIPLCHSGLTPDSLPVPLNSFQGAMLNNKDDIKKLFLRIANWNDIAAPDVADEDFFQAIREFEEKITSSILRKDSQFVFNILWRHVEVLKYSIYASTVDPDELGNIDYRLSKIEDHMFTFNDIYRLYEFSLLMRYHLKKVYQVFYTSAHQLADDIKFVLSNSHLKLAPALQDILHEFLFSIVLMDEWYNMVATLDSSRESITKMVKETPLPPQFKQSNAINHYILYYNTLLLYQSWIGKYELLVASLIGEPADG